jgi:hypothetical protein
VVTTADCVGGWKREAGSWKLEAGSWKLEAGSWKLEAGSWKLEAGKAREAQSPRALSDYLAAQIP